MHAMLPHMLLAGTCLGGGSAHADAKFAILTSRATHSSPSVSSSASKSEPFLPVASSTTCVCVCVCVCVFCNALVCSDSSTHAQTCDLEVVTLGSLSAEGDCKCCCCVLTLDLSAIESGFCSISPGSQ